MKWRTIIIVLIFSAGFLWAEKESDSICRGGFFEAAVPSGFTTVPSLGREKKEGPDSVVFMSSDGKVSFYIFAPQYYYEPTDILPMSDETLIDEKKENKKGTVHRWFTFKSSSGVTRSYHEIRDFDRNRILITGFKFSNHKKYEKYKKKYFAFKKSIRHFDE